MFTIIFRAIFIYSIILGVFRIMGKRQIGQMQPFELVLTLIIADLATIPMSDTSLPLLHGIIPLLSLMVIHFFLIIFTQKSNKFNRLINGKPIIVLNPNGIDYDALKSLNISIDDLLESLRNAGYFSFDEVEYAIVETTGIVNVLPKAQKQTVTCEDLLIKKEKNSLPITLFSEGKKMFENIKLANITEEEIDNILKKEKITKTKNLIVLTLDNNGKIYFQEKNKPFKIINSNLKGRNPI